MLPSRFASSLAPLSLFVVVACSSSNFDVASGNGGDSGNDDTAQGGDSSQVDSTNDDTGGAPGDSPFTDVPSPGDGVADGIGGDSTSGCPGTTCPDPASGGARCVDLATDPLNCGACGKAVCHGEMCKGSAPTCVPGFLACGATGCLGCKDVFADPTNCGVCGKICATGEICAAGSCKLATDGCPTDTTLCTPPTGSGAGWCANLAIDRNNCGGCGKACAPDEYCNKSGCVKYTSAPGCSTCPCSSCTAKFDTCCRYGGDVVCSEGDCPGG